MPPQLARRVAQLLAPLPTALEERRGHGVWSVLRHVYPHAGVPVVQLSIDETRAAPFHYEIGRRLAPLREEGVLIVGSGNLVQHAVDPYSWAVSFESRARQLLLGGEHTPLVDYEKLGSEATLSVPTPDHYLPSLYVIGAGVEGDAVRFPVEGVDGGSISMLAVQIG